MGPRDGRLRTRWPRNRHEHAVRARLGYLRAPKWPASICNTTSACAFVRPSRVPAPAFETPARCVACASLTSSRGSLRRRRAAPPSRHRVGEARDGGQPAAEAQQQQKSRQPSQGSCLAHLPPFWRSTTGLPVRGACGSLLFRQDKKRKQLPTKNNVEK